MATKKQAKQAPKKTAITQAVAESNRRNKLMRPSKEIVEATKKHAKSKAASKGWATRRAKATIEQQAHFHVRPNTPSAGSYVENIQMDRAINSATAIIDPRPAEGTITELARQNESTSLRLGANIGSLLNRLRVKLYGSEIPIDPSKTSAHSASIIISAQERTQENLEAALKMIEEMDNLQEVNL